MFICFVGDTKIEIPELKLETAALTQFPTCVVLKHHCQENIRGEHGVFGPFSETLLTRPRYSQQ